MHILYAVIQDFGAHGAAGHRVFLPCCFCCLREIGDSDNLSSDRCTSALLSLVANEVVFTLSAYLWWVTSFLLMPVEVALRRGGVPGA